MNVSIAVPALIAFAVSLVTGPAMLSFLHRLKFGQYIREEGPRSHQKKSGTPTMGGVLILLSLLAGTVFFASANPRVVPVLLVTFGFGLIGFLDDYIKVVMKRNLGLTPIQKMGGQLLVSIAFSVYMLRFSGLDTCFRIPFTGGLRLELGIFYVPVVIFIMLGTVNGANFTDGLDGLASSVTAVITVFLLAIAAGSGLHPVIGAMLGALLGFLWFNTYPARVFMGDTGSLALGGFVVSSAFILQVPLYLPFIAFIYFIEVLSVIIQVSYYKRTKKRVFKMAPIHHHFELSGWPETKVVSIFTIVTAMLCLVALAGY